MTQWIACDQCVSKTADDALSTDAAKDGEVSIVTGRARQNFVCDRCGISLPFAGRCHVVCIMTPVQRASVPSVAHWVGYYVDAET